MSRRKWNAYVCATQWPCRDYENVAQWIRPKWHEKFKSYLVAVGLICDSCGLQLNLSSTRHRTARPFRVAHFFGENLIASKLCESMAEMRKIHVLHAFQPYFRTLQIYNAENFTQSDRLKILRNFGFTVVVTAFVALIPNTILLAIWLLIEHDAPLRKLVIAIPLLLTLLYTLIAYIVLALRNRAIGGTIGELQSVIDQRGSLQN